MSAASARDRDELSWEEWGDRVDHYLRHVVMLFSPELIILGGGASKKPDKWVHRLDPGCEIAIAEMANNAGHRRRCAARSTGPCTVVSSRVTLVLVDRERRSRRA